MKEEESRRVKENSSFTLFLFSSILSCLDKKRESFDFWDSLGYVGIMDDYRLTIFLTALPCGRVALRI